MRRDVAGRAGVGVVAPGAADLVAAVDHQEVAAAVLGQPDGGAESGESGADDEDVDVAARLGAAERRLANRACLGHAVDANPH